MRGTWKTIYAVAIALPICAAAIGYYVQILSYSNEEAKMNTCIANLKQIDGGIINYAIENKLNQGDSFPLYEVTQYLKGNTLPKCPCGGSYNIPRVGGSPTCSYHGNPLAERVPSGLAVYIKNRPANAPTQAK